MTLVDIYLSLKVRLMRAQSHTGFIIMPATLTATIATYFKVSNISSWYSILVFLLLIAVQILIGHLDVKYGVFAKETSLNNQHNPEVQKLLERLQK